MLINFGNRISQNFKNHVLGNFVTQVVMILHIKAYQKLMLHIFRAHHKSMLLVIRARQTASFKLKSIILTVFQRNTALTYDI